jgi:hypothetical protein
MKVVQPAATPCGYAVDGLGFYYIPYIGVQKNKIEEKTATVRVIDGSLTANQLAVELQRLLLGKNKWVIEDKGTDAFITTFPSGDLLQQVVEWGPMETEIVKAKIKFEKGADNDVYKYSKSLGSVQRSVQGIDRFLHHLGRWVHLGSNSSSG